MNETKMVHVLMALLLVSFVMVLAGAAMIFGAVGFMAFRSICKADGREAVEAAAAGKDSMAAGVHCADWRGLYGGRKEIRLEDTPADTHLDHREGDVSDIGHDDLTAAPATVEPGRDRGPGDVAQLLSPDGAPREVRGEAGDGGRAECAKSRDCGTARHNPLDKRFFHGGDYSKGAAGAQREETAP